MGIEPFLVGSALDCVLAQLLARRLCPKCKEAYVPTPQYMLDDRFPWQDGMELPTLFRPAGCSACSKTCTSTPALLRPKAAASPPTPPPTTATSTS